MLTSGRSEPSRPGAEATLRAGVLAVFVCGVLGLLAELLLSGHDEGFWQRVPLGLLAAALPLVFVQGRGRSTALAWLFRLLMLLFIASGALGLWFHHAASVAFELESHPDARGWPLFWSALVGISPPALAPGAMAGLGVLGLLWAHRPPPPAELKNEIAPSSAGPRGRSSDPGGHR